MQILPALCLAACLPVLPALAGETDWQDIAPDVSVRLISAGVVTPDGKALLALEIDMPDSTKTYWRVPGETGLPIDLDFSASTAVEAHQVLWPYPLREDKGEGLDYVYYGHTVLPIELTVTDAAGMVDMLATLGICSDICVPARVRLALPLSDAEPDMPNGLRIRQAMAEVPISWDEGPEPIGPATLLPDTAGLAVGLAGDVANPASIIAATMEGEPLFGAPQKSPHGDLVVLPILGKTDNSALEGMEVEITFMTEMGAFAVSRTMEAGNAVFETGLGQ